MKVIKRFIAICLLSLPMATALADVVCQELPPGSGVVVCRDSQTGHVETCQEIPPHSGRVVCR